MLSIATALALRAHGLPWAPAIGDRFVIVDRDMDDEVFVLSDMTIEARNYPTGTILAFNGTTEWALDSVAAEGALWLPREQQLRLALGPAFAGLRPGGPGFEVGVSPDGRCVEWTAARDAEEAYALAVLSRDGQRDPLRLLPVAAEELGWRVHAVPEDAWDARTSADGRTVREVVAAVVREHREVPHLLAGSARADLPDQHDPDLVGGDPAAAWDDAIAASLRAWTTVVGEDPPVAAARGPVPAREHAEQLLVHLLVHAWDVARATGIEERLHRGCVRHALEHVLGRTTHPRRGSPDGVPASSADPQGQLLALLGRDPAVSSST